MQQIERYGVIALVFLLVTIVAVSFWGDNKSPGFWSRLTGRGAKKEATSTQMADATTPPGSAAERAIQSDLPMSPAGTPAASSNPIVTPIESAPPTNVASTPRPQAQNPLTAGTVPPAPMTHFATPAPEPAHTTRAVTAAVPTAGSSEYVVQKGDNLMLIASRSLGSKSRWTEIRDMNPRIDPKSLKVGTKLAMPASASVSKSGAPAATPVHKSATAPASKNPSGSTGTYVVRKGDTMKSIAEHALGDRARWSEIAASNPKLDPHHLSVGTSLRMPGGKSAEPLVASAMTSDLSNRPHVR
jgi:nucleoid-associated protein YgaU